MKLIIYVTLPTLCATVVRHAWGASDAWFFLGVFVLFGVAAIPLTVIGGMVDANNVLKVLGRNDVGDRRQGS